MGNQKTDVLMTRKVKVSVSSVTRKMVIFLGPSQSLLAKDYI